jgi:hypothetical protein
MFLPTLLVDGRVVGTWKRTVAKTLVTVTANPFGRLTKSDATAFTAAAERYGEFLGMPVKTNLRP